MEFNFSGISRFSALGRFLRFVLRMLPAGSVVPILQGPLRGRRWIVGSSNHGCWLGSYEHECQLAFRSVTHDGDVVYDVGANVGYYSLLASRLVGPAGKVFAFEPFPRNVDLLKKHLRLNDVLNVSLVQSAVSSVNGEVYFESSPDPSSGHVSEGHGDLRIPSVTLDTLVFERSTPPPQVIKIDVEGAELSVLKGGLETLRRCRPAILLALHGHANEECSEFLRGLGFVLDVIDGYLATGAQATLLATSAGSSAGLGKRPSSAFAGSPAAEK
jgi:FkbM family methyltransferase